ncbi:MAG: FxsA family protein [Solirubrobacterales bacterium]
MPFLVAALIIVPLIEIFVIIQVGQLVGPWWTIALLILSSVVGAVLMKREGSKAWERFTSALGRGRIPAKETADGGLVIFGGALLLTPGFVTDLVGLLMLIPGSRDLVRRFMVARAIDIGVGGLGRPVAWGVRGARWGTRGYRYANGRRAAREYDVDGTATEVTDPAASLPPRSSS